MGSLFSTMEEYRAYYKRRQELWEEFNPPEGGGKSWDDPRFEAFCAARMSPQLVTVSPVTVSPAGALVPLARIHRLERTERSSSSMISMSRADTRSRAETRVLEKQQAGGRKSHQRGGKN